VARIVKRLAPAKINLALHITGKRGDGYHELDTLVAFTELGDIVSVEADYSLYMDVSGTFAGPLSSWDQLQDNLMMKAARLLQMRADEDGKRPAFSGAKMRLVKQLPVAAGIGGGSSDAAATLSCLNVLWELNYSEQELQAIGLALGADVPMCIEPLPVRARGIGEKLETLSVPNFPIVLINNGKPLATKDVFAKLENKASKPLGNTPPNPSPTDKVTAWISSWMEWIADHTNDLQPAAEAAGLDLSPLRHYAKLFKDEDRKPVLRMSGSGATWFGLCWTPEQAKTLARAVMMDHPEWWIKTTHIESVSPPLNA
jgi:4-diphosphocytidyl-2-C-methyl-D-erythritol kinase